MGKNFYSYLPTHKDKFFPSNSHSSVISLKKTKILCTIGPVSKSFEALQAMRRAGMSGIRINTAFGNPDQHREIINNIRQVGEVPIMLDLKGPELRVKVSRSIDVKVGDVVEVGEGGPLSFNHNICGQFGVGDTILIDDGKVLLRVTESSDDRLRMVVEHGGTIEDGKGVNVPGKRLDVPSLSEKDMGFVELARETGVEFMALSFVRRKEDVVNLRNVAHGLEAELVAKVESREGIDNFEEILKEADGIIVARGDLGVEMELEKVPLIQKHMIQRCNQEGKLVITATEMLDSMTSNITPTRAEVSDVANAILDGTDVLMLSAETAVGKYPVEAVSMMTRIAKSVEGSVQTRVKEEEFRNISSTVSRSIRQIAEAMSLSKVITMTRTGYTAKVITRFRLHQPIIAVTASRMVQKQLEMYYGVQSIQFDYEREADRILAVTQMLYSRGIVGKDETVLFTAGVRTSKPHASNLIEIHSVAELLELKRPS